MARKREEKAGHNSYKGSRKGKTKASHSHNFTSLRQQLESMGLTLWEIPGDGNCLFRALGDQLDGSPEQHEKHRYDVVEYIRQNRSDFEPFIEDNISFEEYLDNMAEQSTYAGNDCIVAFARLHGVRIVIHQLNTPMWQICGVDDSKKDTRQLHISYHNGDHYNSIRRLGDDACVLPDVHLALEDLVSQPDHDSTCDEDQQSIDEFDSSSEGYPSQLEQDSDEPRWECTSMNRCLHNSSGVDQCIRERLNPEKGHHSCRTLPHQCVVDVPINTKRVEALQSKLKTQQNLSNSKRKELKKQLRKEQAAERKRTDRKTQSEIDEYCSGYPEVGVMKSMACLSI